MIGYMVKMSGVRVRGNIGVEKGSASGVGSVLGLSLESGFSSGLKVG